VLRERGGLVHLFRTAASKPEWDVAYCAGVIAVNTTCRKVELLTARWSDVDLFKREISIERSKTEAGHRLIPLNDEAMAAFARLRKRAETVGGGAPEHFVFPACENSSFDFEHHQKTFRTAWRSLVKAAAKRAGNEAAEHATKSGADPEAARRSATKPFTGFRFHDLRHQSITEMAEAGVRKRQCRASRAIYRKRCWTTTLMFGWLRNGKLWKRWAGDSSYRNPMPSRRRARRTNTGNRQV